MTAKTRVICFSFIGVLFAGALLMVLTTPNAEAQIGDLSQAPPDSAIITLPGFLDFCRRPATSEDVLDMVQPARHVTTPSCRSAR